MSPTHLLRLGAAALWLAAAPVAHSALSFQINADAGTPQYVIDGFAAAASRWSAVLRNDTTVTLNIGYAALPGGALGQTGYSFVQRDYSSVVAALAASTSSADDASAYANLQPGAAYTRLINHTVDNPNGLNSATPYLHTSGVVALTRANARALGLFGADGSPDATIRMNSTAPFDFNPADGVASGQFDFVTIAAHEIGHALGFASVVSRIEQQPAGANDLPATVLDLFRFSAESLAAGKGYLDCTADPRLKFFSTDGGVTVAGPFANGALYGSGIQADHWREFTFTGIMDGQSFPGLQRQIGPIDLKAFDVMGWTIPEPGVPVLISAAALSAWARRRLRPDLQSR